MKATDEAIRLNYPLNATREAIWEAITDIDQMREWYFDNIPDFKALVGFETSFLVKTEDKSITHKWKVLKVIPNHLISYSWRFDEYPGESISIFYIMEDDSGVSLNLEIQTTEDFPDNISEFNTESCIAGWDYFIDGNLKKYLEL